MIYDPMLATSLDYKRWEIPLLQGCDIPDPRDGQPTFEEQQFQWDAEVKLDGVRLIVYLEPNCNHGRALTRVKGKHTGEYANKFGHLAWARTDGLVGATTVIDGEVTWGKNSRETMEILGCDWREAIKRMLDRGEPLKFTAFDLLAFQGTDIRHKPYEKRREYLTNLMFRLMESFHDEVDIVLPGPARALWANCSEGIMLKAPYHTYDCGTRSPSWLKVKRSKRYIAVVTTFNWGKRGKTGAMEGLMGSLCISMVDETGRFVSVGDVGTGFAMADRNPGAWPPRTVVEVESSDITEDNKLWHPRFIRRRPELRVEDAKLGQLASS